MTDPAPTAPGWYPLPGGGKRYWDGTTWAGEPVPPKFGDREPSKPGDVTFAIGLSALFTPLVGIIWGALRMRNNSGDAIKMIVGGVVIWLVVFFIITGHKYL